MDKQVNKRSVVKRFLSTAAAGMIGAVITLASLQYIGGFQSSSQKVNETAPSNVNTQNVSAQSVSFADIVEQASKAVVGVVSERRSNDPFQRAAGETSGSGSGVIFKKTDDAVYIVTNNHVIEGANQINISLHDGKEVAAELVGTDPLTDIAVLKMKKSDGITPIRFGDSSLLRAGDQVVAIGNPLGLDLSRTVTQGIVSGVNRTIEMTTSAGAWNFDVIQTDAAINPGNSGGALINTKGELVGINSLKIAEKGVEGLGFAIPSNQVSRITEELIKNGQIVRPYLGVSVMSLDKVPSVYLENLPENVKEGVLVVSVDEGSEIAKAGLKAQDVIVSVNGKAIKSESDLRKVLYTEMNIGDEVSLDVYRLGKKQTFNAKLASNQQLEMKNDSNS
ncbi:trypsin-like peptidase domain-containing protein [Siminovitchia sp. FSL H7-0308]|uniref:S1C family serine protease n=1 Tax=Siminovitchia sp. FSL H7-0308 TaxID=2921432 RepID=UPI0030EE8C5E